MRFHFAFLFLICVATSFELTWLSPRMIKVFPDDIKINLIQFCSSQLCSNYTVLQISNGRLVSKNLNFPKTYSNVTFYYIGH